MKQQLTKRSISNPFKRLTLLLLFMATIFSAQAQIDYTLYFGQMTDSDNRWSLFKGSTLTEANEYTENTGTWSATANTLTFDGFVFETTGQRALNLTAEVTIVLTNNNSLTSSWSPSACVFTGGNNLTIQGDGSLTVSTNDGSGTQWGISANSGGTVKIGGNATVTVNSGTSSGSSSYGIQAQNLTIQDNATVIVSAGNAETDNMSSYGVVISGTFTMTGGNLTAGSGEVSSSGSGVSVAIKQLRKSLVLL